MKNEIKITQKGFTLIELLTVVGIVAILAAIILGFISQSRAKAADARTQEALGTVRTLAAEQRVAGESFGPAFDSGGKVATLVATLADQQQLEEGEYASHADVDTFVVAFPLKAEEGYWCVDAQGIAQQISALPSSTAPYGCNNLATGGGDDEEPDDGSPQITLNGGTMYYQVPPPPTYWPNINQYVEPGFQATDTKDGNLATSVVISNPDMPGCMTCYFWRMQPCPAENPNYPAVEFRRTYTVTDSDNNTTAVTRTVRITQCTSW